MAERDITLRLKIDKSDIASNLNDISNKIAELKNRQAELNQAFREGKISASEYANETAKLKADMSSMSAQSGLAAKAINAQKGSIDELNNALQLNRKAYNALSQEQRENVNIGGKLRDTINKQQSSLSDLNAAVGKPGLRGGLSGMFSGMADSIGAAALAFVSIEGAMETFKFVVRQSGDATDYFEQQIAGLNGALADLGRMVVNGDFTNFWDNLRVGAKNAAEVKAAMQDFGDRQNISMAKRKQLGLEITKIEEELSEIARKNPETSDIYIKKHNELIEKRKEVAKIIKEEAAEEYGIALKTLEKNEATRISYAKLFDSFKTMKPEVAKAIQDLAPTNTNWTESYLSTVQEQFKMLKQAAPELSRDMLNNIKVLEEVQAKNDQGKAVDESLARARTMAAKMYAISIGISEDQSKIFLDLFNKPAEIVSKTFESFGKLQDAETNVVATAIESNKAITNMEYRVAEKRKKDAEEKERAAKEEAKRRESDMAESIKINAEHNAALGDMERERLEKLKEANEDYKDFIKSNGEEIRFLMIEGEGEYIQTEYELKLEQLQNNRDYLLEKLKDDEDYQIKKIEILNTYNTQEALLTKKRNKDIRVSELNRQAATIDIWAGTFSSINGIAQSFNDKQRELKYAALVLESAGSIASLFINYQIASAKGFAQMGPILGIPAAAAMQVALGVSVAAVVAKTAAGLAEINSAYKASNTSKDVKVDKPDNKFVNGTFGLGGSIYGNSHTDGGVMVNAEGGEFIVNKRAMSNPMIAETVKAFNSAGNGYGTASGFVTRDEMVEYTINTIKAIPVYVTESEITDLQKRVAVRENKFII